MPPTGGKPGRAGGEIYFSLRLYEKEVDGGHALPGNVGFVVSLPDRESFSPDAAWYTNSIAGMSFLRGAQAFAVEVRSENDYGAVAERAMRQKRADYFAAGTEVVWDVDLLQADVVNKYSSVNPDVPEIFRRGEIADAEPAVPGWRMPVDDLFA